MTLSIPSVLAVIVLAVSTSPVVDAQIRRRNNGHRARLLEQVVWDPQEGVLEEEPLVLIEDVSFTMGHELVCPFLSSSNDPKHFQMEWGDFSMELVSISMSMHMMSLGSTKTSSKGAKGVYGSIVPEIPSEPTVDYQLLTKRSHVDDAHAAMKLVKR